ncbi:MAG: fused signal transduction protein/response regulator [Gallionellaceae bacterium CG1_02_56_997]|nr:MAG: fused signal transduction protein/response regulator [Gallionellaceae bacterium CG1_02_56_997]PIV15498.1 MAG: fused signal transduction protein/response regulator [Gallionellales bacterium CG03_land_8_20_14_0_80_55_15]PIX05193.1 MAG: fused signal transduction protein/response regulator [Gallionellales bacterium CG_4_8_14_3_um_filter_54_18]PJC04722.1 MAG: fused signal transduction protein/response regulator [Gallionellales bacterium CG_4_9_14_0_8_um_filter_55_61]HCJ50236.1 fused signal t
MSDLLRNIDARTKLAGTNKLEILMFTLGRDTRTERQEIFGINVFKVREVMRIPAITRAPEMPAAVEGMVSLRGALVPVINLAKYIRMETDCKPEIMIVTEYNGHTQGFLVKAVDNILRLDWSAMRVPPAMLMAEMGGMVTAITELKDKRLVMLLDVEKVLAETGHFDSDELIFKSVQPITQQNRTVFFADDSSVARNQISRTLDAMHVKHLSAINGRQAWVELAKMADYAESANLPLKNLLQVILTDVEMPEMDGYMLTRKIKADKRFNGIPVLMHSSLSSASNKQLGKSVGVDEYVPKFEPQKLSQTLARLLA